MAKCTEKQLFETWLDIRYADMLNNDILNDLEIEIKDIKKHKRKTKQALEKATKHYKEVYGKEPVLPKRI